MIDKTPFRGMHADSGNVDHSLEQIDVDRLATILSTAIAAEIDAVISREERRLEAFAQQARELVTSGVADMGKSLRLSFHEQVQPVYAELNETLSKTKEFQMKATQSAEMVAEDFSRDAIAATRTVLKALKTADSHIERTRSQTIAAAKLAKQTSEAATAEIRRAGNQMTLRHWAASLGVTVVTILIMLFTLHKMTATWMLTEDQHAALYMGQHVLSEYWDADAERKELIEEILNLTRRSTMDEQNE